MPKQIDESMTLGRYYCGKGYVFYCVRDTSIQSKKDKKYAIYEHRILMYAWGHLESPFFSEDMREIHHIPIEERPLNDLNIETQLEALTPEEHREKDETRANLVTQWDRIAGD